MVMSCKISDHSVIIVTYPEDNDLTCCLKLYLKQSFRSEIIVYCILTLSMLSGPKDLREITATITSKQKYILIIIQSSVSSKFK